MGGADAPSKGAKSRSWEHIANRAVACTVTAKDFSCNAASALLRKE